LVKLQQSPSLATLEKRGELNPRLNTRLNPNLNTRANTASTNATNANTASAVESGSLAQFQSVQSQQAVRSQSRSSEKLRSSQDEAMEASAWERQVAAIGFTAAIRACHEAGDWSAAMRVLAEVESHPPPRFVFVVGMNGVMVRNLFCFLFFSVARN